jgi:hypothetical protein
MLVPNEEKPNPSTCTTTLYIPAGTLVKVADKPDTTA